MTFEGVQVKGRDAILQKFASLTFKVIQRAITKTDCQPLPDGSILVAVIGQLKVCWPHSLNTCSNICDCSRSKKNS
uniref:Nuclear transport factor 2 n=1 Tax=Ascaris suum TaxID=6253 RepID=F1LEF3_ASCSU